MFFRAIPACSRSRALSTVLLSAAAPSQSGTGGGRGPSEPHYGRRRGWPGILAETQFVEPLRGLLLRQDNRKLREIRRRGNP